MPDDVRRSTTPPYMLGFLFSCSPFSVLLSISLTIDECFYLYVSIRCSKDGPYFTTTLPLLALSLLIAVNTVLLRAIYSYDYKAYILETKAMMLHHKKNITTARALFCAVNGEFLDYSGREGHFYQNEIYFHRLSVSDEHTSEYQSTRESRLDISFTNQ